MFNGRDKARITELEGLLGWERSQLEAEQLIHADTVADLKADHLREIDGFRQQIANLEGQVQALNRWGKQRDFMLQFGPYHMAGKGEINGVTFQLIEGRVDYHQANFRLPIPDGEVGL